MAAGDKSAHSGYFGHTLASFLDAKAQEATREKNPQLTADYHAWARVAVRIRDEQSTLRMLEAALAATLDPLARERLEVIVHWTHWFVTR